MLGSFWQHFETVGTKCEKFSFFSKFYSISNLDVFCHFLKISGVRFETISFLLPFALSESYSLFIHIFLDNEHLYEPSITSPRQRSTYGSSTTKQGLYMPIKIEPSIPSTDFDINTKDGLSISILMQGKFDFDPNLFSIRFQNTNNNNLFTYANHITTNHQTRFWSQTNTFDANDPKNLLDLTRLISKSNHQNRLRHRLPSHYREFVSSSPIHRYQLGNTQLWLMT